MATGSEPPRDRPTPLLSREAAHLASLDSAAPPADPVESADAPPEPIRLGPPLSFRTRLTLALIAVAVIPLAAFGVVVVATSTAGVDPSVTGLLLLFAIAIAALLAVVVAYLVAASLTAPLRAIAAAVDRASAGDLSTPIVVSGEDELARLADSHNRLAADLERRNRELGRILAAIATMSPRDGVDFLIGCAAADARGAFGMIDASVYLVDPREIPTEEIVPGDPRPVRSDLRAGREPLGVLAGHLPATRAWERADQDLLDLFASEVAIAIRNAQLFATVEAQNVQLRELDQVLWALLDNAVKHGSRSPVRAEVAVADERRLRVTIEDRGAGVAEPDRERLFGRYVRGERGAEEGSGLGLYVSRELCRAMGGDLVLEPTTEGRGAALSVYLPGEPPDEA